jgi:hypothetical protein
MPTEPLQGERTSASHCLSRGQRAPGGVRVPAMYGGRGWFSAKAQELDPKKVRSTSR